MRLSFCNYVSAGLIPVILMNREIVAQWLEHFSLKQAAHS